MLLNAIVKPRIKSVLYKTKADILHFNFKGF